MTQYFIFNIALAIWVFIDSRERGINGIPYTAGTVILGVLVFPYYMAKRNLLPGEIREGGIAWNTIKNFLIVWTIAMAYASFSGLSKVSESTNGMSDAEMTGAAIGTGLGLMFIGMLWFFPFAGGLLIGLLLKKSKIVEEGPEKLQEEKPTNPFYLNKWFLSIIIFLILYAILLDDDMKNSNNSATKSSQEEKDSAQFYDVGESIQLGEIEVRLLKWELKQNVRTGNQFADLKSEDGSQYIILTVSYKNNTSNTKTLMDTGKVYLVLNGEKYEYDKNETILLDGWDIFMKKIGPLNTLRTKLVFKIPNEQNINLFWMPFQRYPNDLYTLK